MESAARWLVCAGAEEFLFIASALVAAGDADGIEWEPQAMRAYARAAQVGVVGGMNAVIGRGAEGAAPVEVAGVLAGMLGGTVVLCAADARAAGPAAPRAAFSSVEPGGFVRFLLDMRRRGTRLPVAPGGGGSAGGEYDGDDLEEPAAFSWVGAPGAADAPRCGLPDGGIAGDVPAKTGVAAVGVGDGRAGAAGVEAGLRGKATVGDGAATPVDGVRTDGGRCAQTQPIRAMGRLPRVGVDEHPRTARSLDFLPDVPRIGDEGAYADAGVPAGADRAVAIADVGAERAAGALAGTAVPHASDPAPRGAEPLVVPARPGGAPSLSNASALVFPVRPGRMVGNVETEAVAYRPVISFPQLECEVAGADGHVPTICFASPRGGVGKTALAVLAALTLARDGLSVALIDLDLQFGTCLGYLGADETDGLMDAGALPERVRVDARTLARCRTTPERCLAAYEFCRAPEQAEALAGKAAQLVCAARAGADVAIVDLPTGVNEAVAQVLDMADRCLLVSDQRAFALESLASQQSLLARMGVERTKLVTVMNRCDARHRDEGFLSRVQFEVQTPQVMRVVEGGPEVMQMLSIGSAGELLAMRNRFALSTADLAHAICADLGCQPAVPALPTRLAAAPAASAPRGVFRRHRKERRGEQVPCPF